MTPRAVCTRCERPTDGALLTLDAATVARGGGITPLLARLSGALLTRVALLHATHHMSTGLLTLHLDVAPPGAPAP